MSEKKDVVFRRVRGRIVPIRVSKSKREAIKGAALAAGGVATALGAGHVAGSVVHAAAKAENVARTFRARAKEIASSALKNAEPQPMLPGFTAAKRRAKILTPLVKSQVNAAMKSSASAHVKANVLFKASRHSSQMGRILGGALVGAGLTKIYEGVTGREATLKESIIAQTTGQITTVALETGFTTTTRTGGNLLKAIKLVVKSKLKL